MSSHNYLVLDPGNSMGYCIVTITGDKAEIIKYGFYDIDTSSDYEGDSSLDLMQWMSKKIKKYNIEGIAREDYFVSRRCIKGVNINLYYRGAIDIEARKNQLYSVVIGPSEWKRHVCGRSTPTKEQKIKYKKDDKKCMILESLYHKYKIRFPNYSVSQKNGRIIKFRYDISDAVGIAIYFLEKLKNIKTVECNIVPPHDHVWRAGVNIFDYDTLSLAYTKPVKVVKTKCKSILKSGKREGQECGSIAKKDNYCMRHHPSKPKKKSPSVPKVHGTSITIKIPKIHQTNNLINLKEFNSNGKREET